MVSTKILRLTLFALGVQSLALPDVLGGLPGFSLPGQTGEHEPSAPGFPGGDSPSWPGWPGSLGSPQPGPSGNQPGWPAPGSPSWPTSPFLPTTTSHGASSSETSSTPSQSTTVTTFPTTTSSSSVSSTTSTSTLEPSTSTSSSTVPTSTTQSTTLTSSTTSPAAPSTTSTSSTSTSSTTTTTSLSTTTSTTTTTTTTTTSTITPPPGCPTPSFANGGFEDSDTAIDPWVYSNFGYSADEFVGEAGTGTFEPHSGNNYFEVINSQSAPIEVRIAQSPDFCAGATYTITFWAIGDCSGGAGLGLCASENAEDVYVQVVTEFGNSPIFYLSNVGTSDWQEFTYTFTWTGGDGLSPVDFDIFINSEGDALALDDISIAFT